VTELVCKTDFHLKAYSNLLFLFKMHLTSDRKFFVHCQVQAPKRIHCRLPMRMLELSNSVLYGRTPLLPPWITQNKVRAYFSACSYFMYQTTKFHILHTATPTYSHSCHLLFMDVIEKWTKFCIYRP
jgi:hypothetical protein